MPQIKDLIDLPVVETVIQLQSVRDSSRHDPTDQKFLRDLTQSFVLTEDIETNLKVLLDVFMRGQGRGFFVSGSYGSGKSHLLSVVSLLLQYDWAWEPLVAQSRKMNAYRHPLEKKKLVVVEVPLLAFKAIRSLDEIVFESIQNTLSSTRYGIIASLTEESYFLEQFQRYLLPLHRLPLETMIQHEFPEINTWERLLTKNPTAAFNLTRKYLTTIKEKIPFQMTPDREEGFNKLETILKANDFDGIVILIDELSEFLKAKANDRSLNEDARFLQYLGERSAHSPIWIVAALQEHIEKTGNIQEMVLNKIKDRYHTRLELSTQHIRELINYRLILKKDGSQPHIEAAFKKLKYSFNDIPMTFDAFTEIYPVHPETIDILDTCADLFSQRRGVVDFIHYQVKGDSSRNIGGILDEDFTHLLTPDRIFDHFEMRFKESPSLRKYYEIYYDYFHKHIPRLFTEDKNDVIYALRLIKILILLKISHVNVRRTIRQLANMLLYHVFEDLAGQVNYEYIEGHLVRRMVTELGYLKTTAATNPLDATLEIDVEASATARFMEKVKEIQHQAQNAAMIDALIRDLNFGLIPLAAFIGKPYECHNINWANTGRSGSVWLTDLTTIQLKHLQQLVKTFATTDKDFTVILSLPLETEKQRDHAAALLNHVEGRFANGIVWWIPTPFTAFDWLRQWFAYYTISVEFQKDQTEEGLELRKLAETKLEEISRPVKEAMLDCYRKGEFIYANGRFSLDLNLAHHKSFEDILSLIIQKPLDAMYPRHLHIKTMMNLSSPSLVNELVEKFIITGSVESIDAPYNTFLKNLLEGVAMPLQIVKFKDRPRNAYLSVNPEISPGCKVVLEAFQKLEKSRD